MSSEQVRSADPRAWRFDREQVEQMMHGTPLSVLLGSLYAVVVALPFVGIVAAPVLLAWVAAFVAVRLVRLAGLLRWRRQRDSVHDLTGWSRWLLGSAVVQSLVWGLGSWCLVAPGRLVAEAGLHLGLAIVLLSNVLHLSKVLPMLWIYTLGVAVPLVLRNLWVGEMHLALAALTALLAAFALASGHRHARHHEDAQAQRRRNAELIAELQREVQARTEAQARAERAHADKAHFLAAAGHDLRQPLNAIGLLAQGLPRQPTAQQVSQAADCIYECVEQMGDIVDGLLDLSRLDAGGMPMAVSDFDIAALLEAVAADHRDAARAKGLALELDAEPVRARSDAALLQRVLHNLLGNAVRYTNHGAVRVEARRDEAQVRIEVVDTGIGIAAHELERVFEPFYQAGNPARDGRQGHGLGLAIVQRLGRLLDLDLRLRSAPGQGTRVALRVPLACGDPLPPAEAGRAGDDMLLGRRVMVIEDDASSAVALARLLSQWGCEVRQASGANAALAQLHGGWAPDFVVADLRLAEGDDGCRTAMRLRDAVGASLPAVLVTGEADGALACVAQSAGFVVLRKPVRPVQLRAVMNDAFARA